MRRPSRTKSLILPSRPKVTVPRTQNECRDADRGLTPTLFFRSRRDGRNQRQDRSSIVQYLLRELPDTSPNGFYTLVAHHFRRDCDLDSLAGREATAGRRRSVSRTAQCVYSSKVEGLKHDYFPPGRTDLPLVNLPTPVNHPDQNSFGQSHLFKTQSAVLAGHPAKKHP